MVPTGFGFGSGFGNQNQGMGKLDAVLGIGWGREGRRENGDVGQL